MFATYLIVAWRLLWLTYRGLQIINISNPTTPTLKGTHDTSDYAIGVQVVGNYAYVGVWLKQKG